ncbi:hypothetical protein V6N13_009078 [Hibiscus sabdariffa]
MEESFLLLRKQYEQKQYFMQDQDKLHIVIEEKSERIIKEFPKEGGGKMTREEQSVELDTLQWKEEDNKDTKDSDYSPMEDGVQQALRV